MDAMQTDRELIVWVTPARELSLALELERI